MNGEEWRPIPRLGDLYEASSHGRIRSLVSGAPQLLSMWSTQSDGYLKARVGGRAVSSGRFVHCLVLEAFVSPRPDGMVTRHLNGNPADNRVENLAWGTQAENMRDAVRHGTHYEMRRTHCPLGHAYDEKNTGNYTGSNRTCRTCARDRMRKVRAEMRTTRTQKAA